MGEHTAQTRPVPRPPHRHLGIETQHRRPHEGHARAHAGIVDGIPGREVVGPVDDHVVCRDQPVRGRRRHPLGVGLHAHGRVDSGDGLGRRLDLAAPDVGRAVHDLTLQVGELHVVVVGDPESPDSGGRQIEQRRGPQTAGAEDKHAGRSQAPLPGHPHLRQQQMPGVTGAGAGVGELVGAPPGSGVHRGRDYVMAEANTREYDVRWRPDGRTSAVAGRPQPGTKARVAHDRDEQPTGGRDCRAAGRPGGRHPPTGRTAEADPDQPARGSCRAAGSRPAASATGPASPTA